VAVALVVLVVAVATTAGDPAVATEPLGVTVPAGPGQDGVIRLDAVLHLPATVPAPAVLLAHGFGSDRTALIPAAERYARAGYVVLTWSSRGFGASGGVVGLLDPEREVADVSVLLDLLAVHPAVQRDGDDPVVGIAGGSYGGGLALLAAAQEPRLDAVVAAAAWHQLRRALSPPDGPGGVLKEQWLAGLFTALLTGGVGGDRSGTASPPSLADAVPATADLGDLLPDVLPDDGPFDGAAGGAGAPAALACGRLDPAVCRAYVRTMADGRIGDELTASLLDRASIGARASAISAPTLLVAGQQDTLFPLGESLDTAARVPQAAVHWVEGGHGEASRVDTDVAIAWFDRHLSGRGAAPPAFTWTDVVGGVERTADALPGDDPDGTLDLVLGPAGRLVDPDRAGGAGQAVVLFPPGGVPAAVSGLPALDQTGALAGLLPVVDLPLQHAAWTSDPLAGDVALLGTPTLELTVTATAPMALFVKVADVAPGGRATLLQDAVTPLAVPAGRSELVLDLFPLARRVVAGDRIRVTVATTDLAHAQGRAAAAAVVADGRLRLPTTALAATSAVPVRLRIAAPVLLLLALAAVAAVLTRRHERRLGSGQDEPGQDEPGQDEPPIVVRGLVKRYADGTLAVDGLDLTVGRGQVYGLLGPNGAGKTTTMRMLLGLVHPTAGDVRLLGRPLHPGHPVLSRVGVLVEGPGFAPYLSGRQNLDGWWRAGGRPAAEADWDRALGVADLGAAIDRPVRTYSHGMRQRLAIAQALLGRPELLVLDEPTDGLDPEQIRAMRQLLARLGEEGLTVLVSSHLLAEVEQMCTHAAVVQAGRVVAAGPVAELQGATRTIVVQVDDREGARAALADLVPAGGIDVEGAGLVVDLDGADAADVVAALVAAGVRVTAVTPRGRLEDAFLALTGAGPDPAGGP
jgi:ABC-2 type transport system ATP-binding protein